MSGSEFTPVVRRDLRITQKPGGVYEVTTADRPTPFLLYDIEVVVARLMDGTRTLKQVLAEAQRLGIPATADGVEQFTRQLAAYGFLKINGAVPKAPPSAPPRDLVLKLWSEGSRNEAFAHLRDLITNHPTDKSLVELESLLQRQQQADEREKKKGANGTAGFSAISAPSTRRRPRGRGWCRARRCRRRRRPTPRHPARPKTPRAATALRRSAAPTIR
jgi:hypothetical protein